MIIYELSFSLSRFLTSKLVVSSVLKNNMVCCLKLKYFGEYQSRCRCSTLQNSCSVLSDDIKLNPDSYMSINENHDEKSKRIIKSDMVVIDDFLTDDEESSLVAELEPYMKRLRYEFDHWDNAIHGYRETERLKWNEKNSIIIDRIKNLAFPNANKTLTLVHVLDLAEDGYIKPHIDNKRFCGNIIAGLSLLSNSVMRLVHDKDIEKKVDILLKRKSLYIMRDVARYDYTHEILSNKLSMFRGDPVKKTRRISVICRNEPKKEDLI